MIEGPAWLSEASSTSASCACSRLSRIAARVAISATAATTASIDRPRQTDELLRNRAGAGVDRRCYIERRLEARNDNVEVLLGEQRDRARGVDDGDVVAKRLQGSARFVARGAFVLDDQDSMQTAPT